MNNYRGLVKDIADLVSFDMDKNNIQEIFVKFEDVMKKYNIETNEEVSLNVFQKTDMRQLCECLLKDSLNNHIQMYFLFGG